MKRVFIAAILTASCLSAISQMHQTEYPILAVPRSAGANALLSHKLTDQERRLFKEIDSETNKLPANAAPDAYYAVAASVGKRYGLSAKQSVAFFIRTTFSEFEP
jgi:hypothetical protein